MKSSNKAGIVGLRAITDIITDTKIMSHPQSHRLGFPPESHIVLPFDVLLCSQVLLLEALLNKACVQVLPLKQQLTETPLVAFMATAATQWKHLGIGKKLACLCHWTCGNRWFRMRGEPRTSYFGASGSVGSGAEEGFTGVAGFSPKRN